MENERFDFELGRGISNPEDGENELDLPPEYCQYRDEGCELPHNVSIALYLNVFMSCPVDASSG